MSDNPNGAETPNDTPPTPGGESKFEAVTSQEEFDRRIADRIRREREKFANYDELKAKASKFDELEDANKTEAQKAAERIAELESKVNSYETRDQVNQLKTEVANESGVPAHLLRGTTRDELAAHAKEIKELLNEKPQPQRIDPRVSNTPPALNSSALEDAIRRAVGA